MFRAINLWRIKWIENKSFLEEGGKRYWDFSGKTSRKYPYGRS
jgi:hypothetical protein